MQPLDNRAVPGEPRLLCPRAGSPGAISFCRPVRRRGTPGHVRDVFGQYYLWRTRFHRWLGVCVAKSAALSVRRALGELVACLAWRSAVIITGWPRHCLRGLASATQARIAALPVTRRLRRVVPALLFPRGPARE